MAQAPITQTKPKKQHIPDNHNCFALIEGDNIILYSLTLENNKQVFKLKRNTLYIVRKIVKTFKEGEPNPYNIFIVSSETLANQEREDSLHSGTHKGYLYDIVEVTELPIFSEIDQSAAIKILQNYIPNLSFNYKDEKKFKNITKKMEYQIRPNLNTFITYTNNFTISDWLYYIIYKFNLTDLKQFSLPLIEAEIYSERNLYIDLIYDILLNDLKLEPSDSKYFNNNIDLIERITGILYSNIIITLEDLKKLLANKNEIFSTANVIKINLIQYLEGGSDTVTIDF